MYQSKAIQILKKLSAEELDRFVLFARTSFFNPRPSLIPIVETIRNNFSDFEGEWLQKENLFTKIFLNKPYQYSLLGEEMSRLYELAVQFLSYIEWEREPAVRRAQAGLQCVMRGLNDLAEELAEEADQIAEESPFRDGEYFFAKIPISVIKSILKQGDIHDTERDVAVHNAIDIWYLHNKLHYSATMHAQQALVNEVPDIPLFKDLIAGLKNHEYLKTPLIGLYYHGLMMNIDGEESENHYQLFSNIFVAHSQKLPLPDRVAFHTRAKNFCLQRYISGDQEYLTKAFKHDDHAELNGFLIDAGILPERSFKNIATLALECNETDWAERFIGKYAPQLSAETREMTVNLAHAELEYCRGNFDKVRTSLESFKKIDAFDYLKVQTLLMKMTFEQENWNEVQQYSENVRKFFQRNKSISDEYKNRSRSLFDFATRIAKAVTSKRRNLIKFLEELEQEIHSMPVNSKPWLLGQIEKMKNATKHKQGLRKNSRKLSS